MDVRSGSAPPAPAPRRVVRVEDLIREGREVVLLHAGQPYVLRITRNGKLILTK